MFLKLLSEQDAKNFLRVAYLLSIADKPLLWDGKRSSEITPQTDLEKISIQKGEAEQAYISDLKNESAQCQKNTSALKLGWPFPTGDSLNSEEDIEQQFIARIKNLPLSRIDDPENRVAAITTILRELLGEEQVEYPAPPKIMLYELMLLALVDGKVSSIEWTLFNEFKHHYQIEDFIFRELLERAESLSREINKTISVILE